MQTYREFSQTAFDAEGLGLPDRQDWLVVPVGRTRDSGPHEESNFAAAVAMLGGESDAVEVHRFGHWVRGWLEIVLVRPDSRAATVARDIESRLEEYPILDDDDFSERELDEFSESWDWWGHHDFIKSLVSGHGLGEASEELLEQWDRDDAMQCYMNISPEPYHSESSGMCIPYASRAAELIDRPSCARLIRRLRNGSDTPYSDSLLGRHSGGDDGD